MHLHTRPCSTLVPMHWIIHFLVDNQVNGIEPVECMLREEMRLRVRRTNQWHYKVGLKHNLTSYSQ